MKKYFYIFKATLMESLQYLLNIIFGFITFIIIMFVMLNLWNYLYQDANNLINGYSFTQMLWYVAINEMIWFGTRSSILNKEVSNDIKSGKIAYNLNKPYHYIGYIFSKYFGEIIINFLLFNAFTIIFGILFIGPINNFDFINLPFIAISLIFGILINVIIKVGISLTSFWVEDSEPFHWIYNKLLLVVGVFFPIELFPIFLQPLIKYTPVFVVNYGPARLVINFSWSIFYQVLLMQVIYLVVCSILILLLYRKGVKKLNVNGG